MTPAGAFLVRGGKIFLRSDVVRRSATACCDIVGQCHAFGTAPGLHSKLSSDSSPPLWVVDALPARSPCAPSTRGIVLGGFRRCASGLGLDAAPSACALHPKGASTVPCALGRGGACSRAAHTLAAEKKGSECGSCGLSDCSDASHAGGRAAEASPECQKCQIGECSQSSPAPHGCGEVCWRCQRHFGRRPLFFCPGCQSLLGPLEHPNYFDLFSLPGTFQLDVDDLDRRFRSLQARVHPDRFTRASAREQTHSDDQAALVNEAYAALRDPLARAEYLLTQVHGRALEGPGAPPPEPELLMRALEAREEAEDAAQRGDLDALRRLKAAALAEAGEAEAALGEAFARGDLDAAAGRVVGLKYTRRLLDAVLEKLPFDD